MICRDIKGFSREDDLVTMYEMKESETVILFDMYIKDFLNSVELATVKQLAEANEYNKHIIDIVFGIEYDKKYNDDERMKLYKLLDDDRFLSNESRDLFLF